MNGQNEPVAATFADMTQTDKAYNVERKTDSTVEESISTDEELTVSFKATENRAYKWEASTDSTVIEAGIGNCPTIIQPQLPEVPPMCDQWYKFGKELVEQEKQWAAE